MKRWTVILISPQEGGNIGAAARAIRNFGAGGLRIVAPRCEVHGGDARKFASGAADLVRAAPVFDTLEEALADQQLSIGLTGVSGRHHRLDCVELIPEQMLRGQESRERCALVFGREDRGMLGEEMELCDFLWSLPTNPEFSSLNLSQAVLLALSSVAEAERQLGMTELGRGLAPSSRTINPLAGSDDPMDQPAEQHEMAILIERLETLMVRTGWKGDRRVRNSIGRFRNLLTRGNATRRDVRMLLGVFRQALLAIEKPELFADKQQPPKDLTDG